MPFNVDKSTHVSFTKTANQFCFNNTEVNLVDIQKDLGDIIPNDMSWNLHNNKAGLKAKKKIFAIIRKILNLNRVAKLNLFKLMIIPEIFFASPFFGLNNYVTSKLETLQPKAVKMDLR